MGRLSLFRTAFDDLPAQLDERSDVSFTQTGQPPLHGGGRGEGSRRDSGWVAVHQYRGAPYEDYFHGVEAIMEEFDGRPRWGKLHFQSAASLSRRYPEWDAFMAVRARLDPIGTFRNDYLDRVLGPISG